MERSSLSSTDNGPDANEKSVPADVVRSIYPRLCLGLMPLAGVIIGPVGIRHRGSWR